MINSVHISDSTIYGSSWASLALRPLFTEQNKVIGWLEIMGVLADVQAEFDLIPKQAAIEINATYRNLSIDEAFLKEVEQGYLITQHSLMGLINTFKNHCGSLGGEWLCYGATVQDITDTHTVRTLLKVHDYFLLELSEIKKCLIYLATQHKHTLMCGRTHSQPGLPITFGFKVAIWLDELQRHHQRLLELRPRLGVGQLCGGVGSLSSLGPKALSLQRAFMHRLGLEPPGISWINSRDRYAEWLNILAMIASTGDKIGQEVVNLQRPEIGELSEGLSSGNVGSITMPQKRNPEISEHLGTLARAIRHHAAHMAENLVHSHERDGRSWKGEWLIIPEATLATGKLLALLKTLLQDLQVNKIQMLANISASNGFIHAEAVMLELAKSIGKQSAHQLILEVSHHANKEGINFKQALLNHPKTRALLTSQDIDKLFDLEKSTAMCVYMIEQTINQCQ